MDQLAPSPLAESIPTALLPEEQTSLGMPSLLTQSAQHQLLRMFRDPYVLKPEERTELVAQLRDAVALEPSLPELRVFLGMALCVNMEVQNGRQELREATRIAPYTFVARLKLGELLMRLRICDLAAEQTRIARNLATNQPQSELARRQAATIRAVQRSDPARNEHEKTVAVASRVRRLLRAARGAARIGTSRS